MSEFSSLLHAAEQLATDVEGNEELPRVERSLGQVLEATQELYSRVTQTGGHEIQAHVLLGSKGIDLPQISQNLETLSSRRTFEPLHPIADSDIESFLRNERENAILSLIDEVNKSALQSIEEQKWEHMVAEWNQEKIKLMNAMIGPSQNWLDLKKAPESSMLEDTSRRIGHSMLNDQETAYAKQVYNHNKIVLQGALRPSLVQKFAQVADEFNDSKVKEIWNIIKTMSSIPPLAKNDDPLKSRAAPVVQKALTTQGRTYLEQRYKTYMRSIVMDNLQSAQRGGVPGTYPLVKGFVGLKLQGQALLGLVDGQIEDKPLWPMVYYCLRSGDMEAALYCVKNAASCPSDFVEVLEELVKKPGCPLSNKTQTSINFHYSRNIRNTTDPYKRAVYCILGSCDISDEHPEVASTADDYLWLQLSVIKDEGRVTTDSDTFTYSDLQKLVLEEYGETHYRAYEQPLVYFQVLALTGQFEAAIEFLSRIPRYQVHSVHMAIALNELYLLGGPRTVQAPLISVDVEDPQPMRRLNLARLILLYVRKFEVTNPDEALQYFYFLRNMKDASGKNLFMICVSDLALECRNYDAIFGKIHPDTGMKTKGLVDQFNSSLVDSKQIAGSVAEELVKKGLFEDAINMFDLADNVEQVFDLCNTLLSQVVSEPMRTGSLRERLTLICRSLKERHANAQLPANIQNTFDMLTQLITFFDQYHSHNYVGGLETLSECKLVPLRASEEQERVMSFRHLSGEVCRVIPDVLLAAITILYTQYQTSKGNHNLTQDGKDKSDLGFGKHIAAVVQKAYKVLGFVIRNSKYFKDPETLRVLYDTLVRTILESGSIIWAPSTVTHILMLEKHVEFLREQAEALTSFAGNIPYRMPGDTYSQLTQMQILMH